MARRQDLDALAWGDAPGSLTTDVFTAREDGERPATTLEGGGKGQREQAVPVPGWAVVDLFCGIGGLSYGLQRAGLPVVAGPDADKTCKCALEANTGARFVGVSLEQDRAISLRETALLQCFPPNYLLAAPQSAVTFAHLGRHIGNAVPVALAVAIGHSIRSHIGEVAA